MQSYEIFVFIICLAAMFSYINHRFLKWTPTIGIMALSLGTSVLLSGASKLFPVQAAPLLRFLISIDFHRVLMKGMLSFLLFAGSIHIDSERLKKERWPIVALASLGTIISVFLVGTFLFFTFVLFHLSIGYIYCLLFAALISPTDPIAVLAILKRAGIGKSLELKIAGESLFNDGVAVVIFLTILEVAQVGIDHLSVADVAILFIREAGGGLLYGLLLGYAGFRAIRSIDNYEVEVLVTIALVTGGYLLADKLGFSGPLAVVVAGIVFGARARQLAPAKHHIDELFRFWELAYVVLNALLFMLMGFEMLVVKISPVTLVIGGIAILIVLLSRYISVSVPLTVLGGRIRFQRNSIAILTWGGLRGGLSVALALSLPADMHRDMLVTITYIVVVFSIMVQGMTIGPLYRRLMGGGKRM